jgi:hypothetical protein
MRYIAGALRGLRFSCVRQRAAAGDRAERSVDRDVGELVALAARLELPEGALDEAVYDSEAPSASSVNNQGIEAQLRWLLSVNEVSTVRRLVQDAAQVDPLRYTARFQPEAWIHDQAVPVDPEGPSEWDCTPFVDEAKLAYLRRLAEREGESLHDLVDGVLDNDDVFKGDPAAPLWIRQWRGPFTIRVVASGLDFAAECGARAQQPRLGGRDGRQRG